jgi:SHS2 domain-containing protein
MKQNCTVEELSHTAEIGVRVGADTPAQLFGCVAEAVFQMMGADMNSRAPNHLHTVNLDAYDIESLMVDWLSELLYLHETTNQIFTECEVTDWTENSLTATVSGRLPKEPPVMHVKAITYHELEVKAVDGRWLAQVYFDI